MPTYLDERLGTHFLDSSHGVSDVVLIRLCVCLTQIAYVTNSAYQEDPLRQGHFLLSSQILWVL